MSWDVVLIKTDTNREPINAIGEPIPFSRSTLVEAVRTAYPEANCDDETWLMLDSPTFSIEFNIGEDPIQCVMLQIRGSNEPLEVISYLCRELDCRAYDTSTGEFIERGKETAFNEWKQYRCKVIGECSAKE